MKKKFHSLIWGLKIAIERNFRLLLFWLVISVATAFLPAVSILMYRNLLLHLSEFALLSNKMDVNLYQLISSLVKFCIVLAISGISLLINDNLLYVVIMRKILLTVAQIDFPLCANQKVSIYTLALVLQAYSANDCRNTDPPTLRKPLNSASRACFGPFCPNTIVSIIRSRHP